jgi:hypothetical protein
MKFGGGEDGEIAKNDVAERKEVRLEREKGNGIEKQGSGKRLPS